MSNLACEFVKRWEGCRLDSYYDTGGVWTIGYGATGHDVQGGIKWTPEQAEKRLEADLEKARQAVRRRVVTSLTDNQEAALTSFVFNLGEGNFSKSKLLAFINQGDHINAALELVQWHHDNGRKIKGLLRRRLEEAALYLT